MSRLSIEVTADQHRAIKVMASMKGMKIKDFILSAVLSEKTAKKASKQLKQALKELEEGDVLRYENPEAFFAKYNL